VFGTKKPEVKSPDPGAAVEECFQTAKTEIGRRDPLSGEACGLKRCGPALR